MEACQYELKNSKMFHTWMSLYMRYPAGDIFFVISWKYFQRKTSSPVSVDPNHNVNSSMYKVVVGYFYKIIGTHMFDLWIIKQAFIANGIWHVGDFASNVLVLRLISETKIRKVIEIGSHDTENIGNTCVYFYLGGISNCSVNANKVLYEDIV